MSTLIHTSLLADTAPNAAGARQRTLSPDLPPKPDRAIEHLSPEGIPLVGLFQDIPSAIWKVFLSAWGGFFVLIWLFFAVEGEAAFFVAIVLLFGAMAFGLPMVLARQCHNPAHRCHGAIDTRTGPMTVTAAGVQIALIPIAIVVGLLGFILFAK